MFFDEATIEVRSGRGGNGCISFHREKFTPKGGPDGGHGGTGGSVVLRVDGQLNTLYAFSRRRHFAAENGGHGEANRRHGRNGASLTIPVPSGTVVRDAVSGEFLGDLTVEAQELVVVRGGRGGRGNETFKTPTRQAPHFAEKGAPGEERTLHLELRLIADVGLLGKPNAGKSTLLSRVSAARPKIADYPFTTLSPMLGTVDVRGRTIVMADIPGLIEGAHAGAGLGLEFLRHVERTRLLIHLLDGASPDPAGDFAAINHELELYSAKLAARPQIVALNKLDVSEARERWAALQSELGVRLYAISAVTGEGVPELLDAVMARLDELPRPRPEDELPVLRPLEQRESKAFTIEQESPGVFRLRGQEIERLAIMTDWENDEALERFWRIMVARGISEAMDTAGVQLGDTVHIGQFELEWQ